MPGYRTPAQHFMTGEMSANLGITDPSRLQQFHPSSIPEPTETARGHGHMEALGSREGLFSLGEFFTSETLPGIGKGEDIHDDEQFTGIGQNVFEGVFRGPVAYGMSGVQSPPPPPPPHGGGGGIPHDYAAPYQPVPVPQLPHNMHRAMPSQCVHEQSYRA